MKRNKEEQKREGEGQEPSPEFEPRMSSLVDQCLNHCTMLFVGFVCIINLEHSNYQFLGVFLGFCLFFHLNKIEFLFPNLGVAPSKKFSAKTHSLVCQVQTMKF